MNWHQPGSIALWFIGLIPVSYVFIAPSSVIPDLAKVLLIFFIVFSLMSLIWINYVISANHLGPLISRINPITEVIWVRITKDHILAFQRAKKGVYGQTKATMYGKKADVIDKGDFPIRTINGNNAIFVYDKMSHNVNVDHAVWWKQLFKKHDVQSGAEAYKKAKKVGDTK